MTNVTVDQETLVNEFIDAFRHAVFQATADDKKDAVLTWASEFLDDPTKDRFLALLDDPRFQDVISLIADQYAIQDSAFRIKTDELIKASSSSPSLPPLEEAPVSQQSSRRGKVSLPSVNIGRKQLLYVVGMIVLALCAAAIYFFVIRDEGNVASEQETFTVEPTFPPATITSVEPITEESQTESGSTLFAPASTTCEYMVEQRLPADINVMLYKSLDFSSEGTVGPIPYQYYYIHKLGNGADALMVIYENRIAYAPSSYFPVPGTPECAEGLVLIAIQTGQTQIAPNVQLSSLLVGKWRWITLGSIIILTLAGVFESFLKRRPFALLLFIVGMVVLFTWNSPSIENDSQSLLRLFLFGLILSIGLGGRENLIESRESMDRTMPEARISTEVDELTKFDPGIRGIFDRFDWSYMAIYGGFLEALSLTLVGSILTWMWGFTGFLVAVIIADAGLLLEVLRRNKKGDWRVFIGTLIGGLLMGVLVYILPHGSSMQVIALLVAFVIGITTLLGLGLTNVSPISKDRIPEGIYGMVVNFLAILAILVQVFPEFNGLQF